MKAAPLRMTAISKRSLSLSRPGHVSSSMYMRHISLGGRMKPLVLALSVIAAAGCASSAAPLDPPQLFVIAQDAQYSSAPHATVAIINFSAVITNSSDQPAALGCGISLQRNTGAGFHFVSVGACLASGASTEMVPARGQRTYQLTKDLPLASVDESASYRIIVPFYFGPAFKTGISITSEPFTISSTSR